METVRLTKRQCDLIESHAHLPGKVVGAVLRGRGGDVEEAGSEAQMALVDAALAFEDQCEFGAFAFTRIRYHLLKWLGKRKCRSLDQVVIGDGKETTLGALVADTNAMRPDQLAENNEKKTRMVETLKKNGSITLTECRELTPAPAKLGDYYSQMRARICASVSGDDVEAIMKSLVARAKKGDIGAAKLVLAQVAGPAAPRVKQSIEVKTVTLEDLEDGDG